MVGSGLGGPWARLWEGKTRRSLAVWGGAELPCLVSLVQERRLLSLLKSRSSRITEKALQHWARVTALETAENRQAGAVLTGEAAVIDSLGALIMKLIDPMRIIGNRKEAPSTVRRNTFLFV